MPELPEVEMVRRRIQARCLGRTVAEVKVLDPAILDGTSPSEFRRRTEGRKVEDALRHGKQLFLDMGDGLMTVHLGMTGDLLALEEGGELPSYARAVLEFDDGGLLAYDDPRKFGAIGLASSVRGFVMEHGLGPDALAIAGKQFIAKASRSARSLKSLLLDQHVLAGVGNLYADEALFRSRLYPLQPADSLDKAALGRLCGNVKRVLRASIGAGTDFSQLPGSYLLRERREGARCPRGNGELMVMRVGGRSSYYCPACQVLR